MNLVVSILPQPYKGLKNRSKTVRENKKIEEKIQELQKLLDENTKKIDKFRKRYAREVTRKSSIIETPKSNTRKLLKNLGIRKVNMKHEVAKKMVFHDVLESNLGNNGINGILVSILFGDNPNKRHYQYVGVCQE
jgi:Fic family protein